MFIVKTVVILVLFVTVAETEWLVLQLWFLLKTSSQIF